MNLGDLFCQKYYTFEFSCRHINDNPQNNFFFIDLGITPLMLSERSRILL